MLGRVPEEFEVVQPIQHSVIHQYDATERMLRYFVQSAHGRSLISRPRLVVNVPSHPRGRAAGGTRCRLRRRGAAGLPGADSDGSGHRR